MENKERKIFCLENTRFIFATNFEGSPDKGRYHSTTRKGNVIIPDEETARQMMDYGINVKQTRPPEGEEEGFVPTYFVSVIINFDCPNRFKPRIYIVSGNSERVRLDEESVGQIDDMWVKNVNVTLAPNEYEEGRFSLYVRTMYVEQSIDDDPFAERYLKRN